MANRWRRVGATLHGFRRELPFTAFVAIGLTAAHVGRLPGTGLALSDFVQRTIMWSSTAEGLGMFIVSNLAVNIRRSDLLIPAMALIVGLHFLPIAFVAKFQPFYVTGIKLVLAAIIGFATVAPKGGEIAGVTAATVLWVAAIIAVHRDWTTKRSAVTAT